MENVRCYFGSNEELEKEKGGRTHYRMVLSFDVPATNSQIRELTNEFLGQTFPKAMAFAAIHRDTDHPHVHVYLHSRHIDGKRINLKSQDYRTIDGKWSKLYSEFAGDRGIHAEHLRKKEENREVEASGASLLLCRQNPRLTRPTVGRSAEPTPSFRGRPHAT